MGIVIIFLLVFLLWRQERRRKRANGNLESGPKKNRRKKWGMYLQTKGELDAERQRRNELEAKMIGQELEAEEIQELPAEEKRLELKSDVCALELEVPAQVRIPTSSQTVANLAKIMRPRSHCQKLTM